MPLDPAARKLRNRRRRLLASILLLIPLSILGLGLSIGTVREDPATQTTLIGKSRRGIPIPARRFGLDGPARVVVVCGMHGIYESGSVALGGFLERKFEEKAPTIGVSLIGKLNPDSELRAPSEGSWAQRFNGNDIVLDPQGRKVGVDLNRNWGTKSWKRDVAYAVGAPMRYAGGKRPFSEPETRALRDFILGQKRAGKRVFVVSFHTRVGNVWSEGSVEPVCGPAGDALGASGQAAKTYARSLGYEIAPEWTDYPISGDFMTWLGERGIEGFEAEMSGNPRGSAIENSEVVPSFLAKLAGMLESLPAP
jgi:hypothetical protein